MRHRFQPRRTFFLMIALLIVTAGCGDCGDPLDPNNFVDPNNFLPDRGMADMGQMDVGADVSDDDVGEPKDSGRQPSDSSFSFDFGTQDGGGDAPLTLTGIVPASGPLEGGNRVRVEGTGFSDGTKVFIAGNEMEVQLSGGVLVGNVPPGSAPGLVTVKVISPDDGSRALVDGYRYVRGLEIDSIVPTRIPTTGGVEVEIRGSGFEDRTAVSFSGDPALRTTVVDDSLLRVLAPPRPRGFADVRVTTSTESVELVEAVEYFEPLEITAVKPASGGTAGGDTVTVEGKGFRSGLTVQFGAAEAAVLDVDTANGTAQVETPPNAEGTVDVFADNGTDTAVLVDGFYYRSDDSPHIAAVIPAYGPELGGNEVLVTGYGFDDPNVRILFGGVEATIIDAAPSYAVVEAPGDSPGLVDVALNSGATELAKKNDAYEYLAALDVTGVMPSSGPAGGGTTVTITGTGFTGATSVMFGGVPADFTVVSDSEITVTTPAHTGGTVDVDVERGRAEATRDDGFTYEALLEIWGFSPTRGAIAGGTHVHVRGAGFYGALEVTLDGFPGTDVRRLDRNNLVFKTPAHAPGETDLQVKADMRTADGPYTYLYFNPASRFGGASGGPVDGAVNVTVFSLGGGPIEGAFVMLSTRADTPYQGFTDANGQLTLSGPEVVGPQTTTATAAGFSSATIQTVDAENVTLFLNQLDPQGGPGSGNPPPFGIIEGDIEAEGKLSDPDDESTYDIAVVRTTQKNTFGGNPAPGPNSIVLGEGRYEITTRIGDMAVVGLCGVYDEDTDTFTPEFMAVERFIFVSDGDRLTVDLVCDIPLNQTVDFKLVNPIFAPAGPDNNRVTLFWDFGFEGVYPSPTIGRGFGSIVQVAGQPPLEGRIADVSFIARGGSYTGVGAPFTQTTIRGVTDVDRVVELPPLLDVPEPDVPQPGGVIDNGMIRFQAAGPYLPDFYYLTLRNEMGIPVWQFLIPGDETSARIPDFPDFSNLPPDQRPQPYTGGQLFMSLIGARMQAGHVWEQFSYRDISTDQWEAYALTTWAVRFP